jgi:hypothetical protein
VRPVRLNRRLQKHRPRVDLELALPQHLRECVRMMWTGGSIGRSVQPTREGGREGGPDRTERGKTSRAPGVCPRPLHQ